MRYKHIILLSIAILFFPLDIFAQEVPDPNEVLKQLIEASEANKSLLVSGHIRVLSHVTFYDDKGLEKRKEIISQPEAIFKDEKVRLDYEIGSGSSVSKIRTVTTKEMSKEYNIGDTVAVIREPKQLPKDFLPSRNTTFGQRFLNYSEEKLISRKITRRSTDDGDVYDVEIVLKQNPQTLLRYVIDPAKGGAIIRYENHHDFGNGHVLLSKNEAEMQPSCNGGWYLKRYTQMSYRPDGTLEEKKEIEIKDFDFVSIVSDDVFTWEGMGLPVGTKIIDRRKGDISYDYGGPQVDDETVYDAHQQPIIQEVNSQNKNAVDIVQSEDKKEEIVPPQEQPQEPVAGQIVNENSDKKNIQASSSRSVYILYVAGISLLLVIVVLVIRRIKLQT